MSTVTFRAILFLVTALCAVRWEVQVQALCSLWSDCCGHSATRQEPGQPAHSPAVAEERCSYYTQSWWAVTLITTYYTQHWAATVPCWSVVYSCTSSIWKCERPWLNLIPKIPRTIGSFVSWGGSNLCLQSNFIFVKTTELNTPKALEALWLLSIA